MNRKKRCSIEEISAGIFVFSLLFCALSCIAAALLVGRGDNEAKLDPEAEFVKELPAPYNLENSYFLPATQDAGLAYQDSLLFFGESTTAHLRSRGVLSGGNGTTQVLADESGTKRLSAKLPYEAVIDPASGESIGLLELLASKQPSVLVLSFGLNGVYGYAADPASFVHDYNTLLDLVQTACPSTAILLQTIYPVASSSDRFNDPYDVNLKISALNGKLPDIAARHEKVYCVDTASVLKDADGALDPTFDNGDGYHLTASAYVEILRYLRTHALEGL